MTPWRRWRRRVRLDPEVVELFADEPELLGIVDAIGATQPRRRARRPGLVPAAAAVAVTAAATALILVVSWPGRGVGVIEEALAAVSAGPVTHAIVSSEVPNNVRVDLASGAVVPVVVSVETWYDRSAGEVRARIRHEGVLVADTVGPAARRAVPGLSDLGDRLFVLRYRDALAAGDATIVRRGTFAGRAAIWLEVELGVRAAEVVIDADSHLPVAFTDVTEQRRLWTVTRFETGTRSEEDFVSDETPMGPEGGRVVTSSPTDPARASAVAGFVPIWAGESVADQSLESVAIETLDSADSGLQSRGVVFRYRGDANLRVRAAPRPEPAYGFVRREFTFGLNPIPADTTIDISRFGDGWLGQMKRRSIYVTIESSRRQVVIDAARALVPLE